MEPVFRLDADLSQEVWLENTRSKRVETLAVEDLRVFHFMSPVSRESILWLVKLEKAGLYAGFIFSRIYKQFGSSLAA